MATDGEGMPTEADFLQGSGTWVFYHEPDDDEWPMGERPELPPNIVVGAE